MDEAGSDYDHREVGGLEGDVGGGVEGVARGILCSQIILAIRNIVLMRNEHEKARGKTKL